MFHFFQLLLIIFSIVIFCQSRKDDDDKNSYSDDIAIQPYRESPEAMGYQNAYYNGSPPHSQQDLRSQQYRYGHGPPEGHYREPYKGRHDCYTGPPDGYGARDHYRR